MTAGRLKEILRMAKHARPDKLHDLYMEVYGADFAGKVTLDRARASIKEACAELLHKAGKEVKGFDLVAPSDPAARVETDPGTMDEGHARNARLPDKRTVRVRPHRTLLPL